MKTEQTLNLQRFSTEGPQIRSFQPLVNKSTLCYKLYLLLANCCPNLETMFLGSNNPQSLNSGVFRHWPRLAYLTLENIMVENIVHCLEEVGGQLRGLKIQCSGFDLSNIAVLCSSEVINYSEGGS